VGASLHTVRVRKQPDSAGSVRSAAKAEPSFLIVEIKLKYTGAAFV